MATWILGDVHGCSLELCELIEALELGPSDTLLACGDLLHRGPDPLGVIEVLEEARARFVLGNHERAVLSRLSLAPEDGAAAKPSAPLGARDLCGDGGLPLAVADEDAGRVVAFLRRHSGYLLTDREVPGAGPTPEGHGWILVHAGLDPRRPPRAQDPRCLTGIRRLAAPGRPFWYEAWTGPELVVFGHTASSIPRAQRSRGRLVALGIDTGCVFGGALTAYSPERHELRSVRAKSGYARAAG